MAWKSIHDSVLSISFEVDIFTGKVGGSLLFENQRRKLPRGGWGHASSGKFWNLDAWKCYFQRFPDNIWALRTIKIKTILTIIYSMFITTVLFLNLSHWLLEKSEMLNLQMLTQKNTFNVLSSCCSFEKTCSAMSASVSLAWTPFWHMRKPGIYSCENVPAISMTLRSQASICFNFLYFHPAWER